MIKRFKVYIVTYDYQIENIKSKYVMTIYLL